MIRKSLPCLLAAASLFLASSGGCGTIVRNPGSDDDEESDAEAPSARAPTPPGDPKERNDGGTGTSSGSVQPPKCKSSLTRAARPPLEGDAAAPWQGELTLDVAVVKGTPAVDVTTQFTYALARPQGTPLTVKPFPLTLEGTHTLTVLKNKAPVCQASIVVTPDDLAQDEAWTVKVVLP